MSVARYGLQKFQNGLRRGGEKVKEGSTYTEHSNSHCMKKLAFERWEEFKTNYIERLNSKMQRNQRSNAKTNC